MIAEQLNRAVAAFTRGDFDRAKMEGLNALRARPDDPSVLQLVGVICCQAGDTAQGVDYLRKAMQRGVDTLDIRLNLARALSELGEHTEAEAICSSPNVSDSRELQRMHADVLKAQARYYEAIAIYERLLESEPNDFEVWTNLGNARHEAGDMTGAFAALRRASELKPDLPLVHTNLGRVLATMDRHEESCLCFQEAVRKNPKDPALLLEFGRGLRRIDRSRDALLPLADAARLSPSDAAIFTEIGQTFVDLEEPERAEQGFRLALQVGPDFLPAYLNLGLLLDGSNRAGELEQLIAAAEQRGLAGPELDYLRALAARRLGDLEKALELAQASAADSIDSSLRLHFIGQVADRLGAVEAAFAAFQEMNSAAAQSPLGVKADPAGYRADVERIAAITTREWLASWKDAVVPSEPPAPAFLVGFPRSGTTLLDTILMGHDATHVLEEVPILAGVAEEIGDLASLAEMEQDDIIAMRARYFERLAEAASEAEGKLIVDKNPLSMLRVPLIHRLFPDARIIVAMRHPADVVLSCFMQNFKVTPATSAFLDLVNASLLYDRVFGYWQKCREIFPLHVHQVRYESMVADPEAEIRPVFEFLGLSWDETVLDHQRTVAGRGYIRTPSFAQVSEPVYERASGRWTRYREQLQYVLPILAPWAERFGYGNPLEPVEPEAAGSGL